MKRITISLEDDLYRIAKAYAMSEGISLSKAVVRLLRRGVEGGRSGTIQEDPAAYGSRETDPRSGFPLRNFEGTITGEEVQREIDDDDLRILEQIRPDAK